MSVPMDSQCYLCHLGRNVELARSLGTEAQATAFARELMGLYLSAPAGVSAPWFGPATTALFQKHYGLDADRYKAEKAASNAFVLARMERIRSLVRQAEEPVLLGLKYAILGNYLDYAALQGEVSLEYLDEMLEKAADMDINTHIFHQFLSELEQGRRLLYLTDNAGEIGFDRIFAEELQRRFPHLEIMFCVRGGNANNDATRADAAAVELPFPVIDNGNTVAGTQLDLLGPEARTAFGQADVILSKGQGNVETLFGCGYPIFYAFLVKCRKFETLFHQPKLTPLFLRERQ